MGIRLYMFLQFFFLLVALPANSRMVRIPFDKPNIQGGIDIAEPGDTVLVAPGTYSGYGNTYITFHGKGSRPPPSGVHASNSMNSLYARRIV